MRGGQWLLLENAWEISTCWGSRVFKAAETLLIGPERKLPSGASFLDKEGNERAEVRLRWWDPAPATLGEALLFRGAPKWGAVEPTANAPPPLT